MHIIEVNLFINIYNLLPFKSIIFLLVSCYIQLSHSFWCYKSLIFFNHKEQNERVKRKLSKMFNFLKTFSSHFLFFRLWGGRDVVRKNFDLIQCISNCSGRHLRDKFYVPNFELEIIKFPGFSV